MKIVENNFKRIILGTIFFCSLFVMVVVVQYARSQGESPKGQGLTVSPPISDFNVKSGESTELTIRLTNPTQDLVEVFPLTMNFGASGEGGEPTFYPAAEEERRFSLASWIVFNQTKIALLPQQVVEFKCQILVPANAEPGGHYGVVFFSTQPPEVSKDQNQVAIASMTGSLVLVNVPGETSEEGFLEEFSARKFFWSPPVDFILRIRNMGNTHFKPHGEIMIKDMFGQNAGIVPVNERRGNVLPESTRKFEEKFETNKNIFGRFSANLRVVYGQSEKTLAGTLVFWIIPWWIIAVAVLILVIFVVLIIFIRRRRRKKREKNNPPPFQGGSAGSGGPSVRPMPFPGPHQHSPGGRRLIVG